jgi:hypothetical protein
MPRVATREGGSAGKSRLVPAAADGGIAILRSEDLERAQPFGVDRVRLTFKSGLQVIVDRQTVSRAASALLDPVRPREFAGRFWGVR